MTDHHSPVTSSTKTNTDLNLVPPSEISEHARQIFDAIARRAYQIFESRGRVPGHDRDDWFLAESELLKPLKFYVRESADHLIAHTEIPALRAHEIKVSVEPVYLRISGTTEARTDENPGEVVMYSLRHSLLPAEHIFHVAELPAEVDPANAKATFKDGTLEVVMPKVSRPKGRQAQAKGA